MVGDAEAWESRVLVWGDSIPAGFLLDVSMKYLSLFVPG